MHITLQDQIMFEILKVTYVHAALSLYRIYHLYLRIVIRSLEIFLLFHYYYANLYGDYYSDIENPFSTSATI